MKLIKSLPFSVLTLLASASSVFAQVATAPASPQATLTPAGGGSGTSSSTLPEAGFAAPTLILLAVGAFFLIVGVYKFSKIFSKR